MPTWVRSPQAQSYNSHKTRYRNCKHSFRVRRITGNRTVSTTEYYVYIENTYTGVYPLPSIQKPLAAIEAQTLGVTTFTGRTDRKRDFARRSQLEICMDMLSAVKDGSERPTQIMYRANLSWLALQTHFKTLVEGGMLKWAESGNRKRYEITEKGRSVLISYHKIKDEIERALQGAFPPGGPDSRVSQRSLLVSG